MWPFRKKNSPDPIQPTDYDSFAQQCVEEVRDLQDKFQSDYNIGWYQNWFYNQPTGLFTFSTNEEELVKEFGDRLKYEKLNTGCFPSDEAESWELTAIAAKLTNGIGIYRPVGDDHLKIFLVITELVDNATAKKIKDRYVQCSKHEYRRVAFVCNHLNQTSRVGLTKLLRRPKAWISARTTTFKHGAMNARKQGNEQMDGTRSQWHLQILEPFAKSAILK